MSDLRPLQSSIPRLTSTTFSKKFVALGRILNHWDDIIGTELSVKAQPIKIHYQKPKDKNEKPNATLDVAVSSADATALHYQKDIMLARINQLFGDNWVTAIRLVHSPANKVSRHDSPITRRAPLLPSDKAKIDNFLNSLNFVETDNDIRTHLEKLGYSVLQKQKGQ